jgi:hypothetical protein
VRQEELEDFLAFNLTFKRLYAVYKVTPSPNLEPYRPAGEYALLFERELNDFPIPVTALIQNGKLVGLNFSVGESPEDILMGIPVADILIPPQQVESWLGLPESLIPTRPADESAAIEPTPAAESDTTDLTASEIAPGANPGWLKYTIPDLHISFDIPETWTIDDTQISDGVLNLLPPNAEPGIVYFALAVDSRNIEEAQAIYRETGGQVTPYTIGGKQWFQVVYEDWERIVLLVPTKENVIVLNTDVFESPEIQQLLASFTIESDGEVAPLAGQSEPASEAVAFEDLPDLVMASSQPDTLFTSLSPDENWQAEIVRYECVLVDPANGSENAYEQIIITRLSDGTQTVAAEQLQYCGGLGSYGFNDLYWSSNSLYYYFDEIRVFNEPDGMPCGLLNTGFSRINVESSIREYVPGNGTAVNENSIHVGWTDHEIVLTDLNNGEISRVPFALPFIIQSVHMSPAGDRFIYTLSETCDPSQGNTVIVLYNLADNTQTILAESANPGYRYGQWENSNQLILLDSEGYQWHYNLETNELTGPNS